MSTFYNDTPDGETLANELNDHYSHSLEVARYGKPDQLWNVSLECMDCDRVVIDVEIITPMADKHAAFMNREHREKGHALVNGGKGWSDCPACRPDGA